MEKISTYRRQLMGFAALAIYFFHVRRPQYPEGSLMARVVPVVVPLLQYGTDIFFLLSGMGLVYAWQKSDGVTDFWIRRARRILLPVWLSGTIVALQQDWSMEDFIGNVSGVNFYAKSVFSYSWFYTAIITLYLLFPLYYRAVKKTARPARTIALSWVVWMILSLLLRGILRRDLFIPFNRAGIFLIGILLGELMCGGWKMTFKPAHYLAGALLSVAGFCAMSVFLRETAPSPLPFAYMWLPATAAACGSAVLLPALFARMDAQGGRVTQGVLKVLGFYGMLSLELICVQEWVGTILERAGMKPNALPELAILTFFAYLYFRGNRLFLKAADAV